MNEIRHTKGYSVNRSIKIITTANTREKISGLNELGQGPPRQKAILNEESISTTTPIIKINISAITLRYLLGLKNSIQFIV